LEQQSLLVEDYAEHPEVVKKSKAVQAEKIKLESLRVKKMALRFAVLLPEEQLAMASIQGYLLIIQQLGQTDRVL